MKRKIIITTVLVIVMLSCLPPSTDITTSPEYKSNSIENTKTNILSQEQEYNISSYKNYMDATLDLLLTKHLNMTTGVVYHSVSADLSMYSVDTGLSSYYWVIHALSNAYAASNNETYKTVMSRVANRMVSIFMDPIYPGFYVNQYSERELNLTKRAGIQAYAYWALEIAESWNSSLDFTVEKESALRCLTDMLYDPVNGGFYFYTLRNGSLDVPEYYSEVYPNDGKRLDHLALAARLLYEVGSSSGNTTLIDMADQAMSFMINHMRYYYSMNFMGLKLAVNRTGGSVAVGELDRVAYSVVTDINAIAIRALIKGYETTGNQTYLDLANQVYEALFAYNWDGDNGGWFEEVVDGEPYDPLDEEDVKFYKYSEIQFQVIQAMEDLYEITDSVYPIRMVIDTLELVLGNLWDSEYEGFVSNTNQVWQYFDPGWEIHYTIVQAQAVVSLDRAWNYGLPIVTRVRVTPSNPRPQDTIYFSATVFDEDGVDTVLVNYTMRNGSNETQGMFPLIAHPSIGGLYNASIENLTDGTSVNFEVFANDTTGQIFVAGIYFFAVREDTFPPIAQLYAIYPTDEVRVGDDVIIDFKTYEFPIHSLTNSCELRWRLNSAPYTSDDMVLIGVADDWLIWRIDLGQFHEGDEIAFFCFVTDEAGNVGESRLYVLTILGPPINITPITVFQILAIAGLIAAPGVGYGYTRIRRGGRKEAQREGKRAARKRARSRGSRRRAYNQKER
ncbi:MAG: hypothetical protein ACFFCP_04745 [Promethearchaeota archaeon]